MSAMISAAVKSLQAKLDGGGLDSGAVNFVIEDEGVVRIDETGVSEGDGPADCTITASAETFQGLLSGDVNPTGAFMSGQLKIDGDMGLAMKIGALLA